MIDGVALTVFIVLFLLVTVLGFYAARWRRGDLGLLEEWGLGGRRFGTLIVWFLLGGDLYTAYTFIAVPALMFGAGALGFFAVPYTILIYPIAFMIMPRLWSICREHGYITPADFVYGRYGSRGLELAIALTGILATLPYIALQLVGIQVVIAAMGVTGTGIAGDLAVDRRVRDPRSLHVHERLARAGDDRRREGHADLHHRHRRRHRDSAETRRLRPHL
jgi:SSS family solute:Na+ symporter